MSDGDQRPRVVVVDAVRIFASFQMVQGHTIHALLDERYAHGRIYETWSYLRGLTSVAFLFAAGLAFYLTTLADVSAHLEKKGAVRRRYVRALVLIAIGYGLHFPRFWLVADILQVIGLTLLLLETLLLVTRRAWAVSLAALVVAIACFALAPITSQWMPHGPFAFAMAYLSQRGGSVFTFVPWAAYLLSGVACGAVVFREGISTSRLSTAWKLSVSAAFVLGASALARLWDDPANAAMNVSFSLTKLGLVLSVAALLAWSTLTVPRVSRSLEVIAGETLAIYVFHLLVLYGEGLGLTFLIGRVLGPYSAVCLALTMCAISAAFGLAWWQLKRYWAQKKSKNAAASV